MTLIKRRFRQTCLVSVLSLLMLSSANAAAPADRDPDSVLYSVPVKVAENVYSAIGAPHYYSYENGGHNNNLSFVIGEQAVLVVNGGTSWQLAEALHTHIKQLTDKPVRYVVDENGQSHAVLGNGYWKAQGATIIAHEDALEEINEKGLDGLENLADILRERADGTELVIPDQTFETSMELDLGGTHVQLMHFGPAHSAGDISVFVPEANVLIAGDIAFHQRLLPVFPETDTAAWLETWKEQFAPFASNRVIIPGHGEPTDFATVDKYTRGYLVDLRGKIGALLEEGGSLQEAYEVDQSEWQNLEAFDQLAAKNAGRVFEAMEFE